MKAQFILTEDEHNKVIQLIDEIDADLGYLVNNLEDPVNLGKCTMALSMAMGKLRSIIHY